jgi:AcrR family transcriptional regulator
VPKVADPALRTALIDAAARLIAHEAGDQLSLRRLAAEVGTSTMAIYTHFGGMDELRVAVSQEGFDRLGQHLDSVAPSRDPVYDLGLLGWEYYRNAMDNPNLYRIMFMTTLPAAGVAGYQTFVTLVRATQRAADMGRFSDADPIERARQIWALSHGVVTLQLAEMLTPDDALGTLWTGAVSLFIGFGDSPAATRRSLTRVTRAERSTARPATRT